MTHPITEPTQSVRERIARRLIDDSPTVFGYHQTHIDMFLPQIDAILSELMEPSEGMLKAGDQAGCEADRRKEVPWSACWKAMIQHIRSGGK